jgi:hypothetical protein
MTETKEEDMRREVLLAFQVALLGMVVPRLRGALVRWSPTEIEAVFLYDGELTADDEETAADVEAEVAASFPDQNVQVRAVHLDSPEPLRCSAPGAWVYRRKE